MQQGPSVLDAMGSLSAVDPVRRILYYLGASNVASQLAIHATIGEDADHNVNNTKEGLTGATALVGIDLDSGEVMFRSIASSGIVLRRAWAIYLLGSECIWW